MTVSRVNVRSSVTVCTLLADVDATLVSVATVRLAEALTDADLLELFVLVLRSRVIDALGSESDADGVMRSTNVPVYVVLALSPSVTE